MIDVLLYDRSTDECESVRESLSNSVALLSDDRLDCRSCHSSKQVYEYIQKDITLDLSLLEIANDTDIALVKKVREFREQADMMLMADGSISPMKYMTPDIRACSLLLKPFSDAEMETVVRALVTAFYRKKEIPGEENSIVIENRHGRIVVPFSSIFYIEAREKKVFFRLRDREYSKYDTLENIKTMLPPEFLQSHRSFVFNSRYIDKVKLSENTIYLEHDIIVPLARSFKASIKEYLNGLSGRRDNCIKK